METRSSKASTSSTGSSGNSGSPKLAAPIAINNATGSDGHLAAAAGETASAAAVPEPRPRPILRRSSLGSPARVQDLPPLALTHNLESAASTSASSSRAQIRWDEETIRMHDAERGTRMKIDEPKTPYTYYDSSNEELDMGTVDPEELARALESVPTGANNQYMPMDVSPDSSASSSAAFSLGESAVPRSSAIVSPMNRKGRSLSLSFSDVTGSESSARGNRSKDSDDEELDEEARARKRRFDQMRATHYNMKEALLRARWARQRSSARGEDGDDGNGDSADDEGENDGSSSSAFYKNVDNEDSENDSDEQTGGANSNSQNSYRQRDRAPASPSRQTDEILAVSTREPSPARNSARREVYTSAQ